jgi:hypothetical protein
MHPGLLIRAGAALLPRFIATAENKEADLSMSHSLKAKKVSTVVMKLQFLQFYNAYNPIFLH